jgi:hypothetical protein
MLIRRFTSFHEVVTWKWLVKSDRWPSGSLCRSWSAPVFTGQRQTPHDVAGRAPCWPVTASAAWAAGINPAVMPTPATTASARSHGVGAVRMLFLPHDGLCGIVDHDPGAAPQFVPLLDHVVVVASHEHIVAMVQVAGQVLDIPDSLAKPIPEPGVAGIKRTRAQPRRQEDLLDHLARLSGPIIDQNAPAIESAVVQAQRLRDAAYDRPLANPAQVSRPPLIASRFLVFVKRRREPQLRPALPAQAGKFFTSVAYACPENRVNDAAGVQGEPEHCGRSRVVHARRSPGGTTKVPHPGSTRT